MPVAGAAAAAVAAVAGAVAAVGTAAAVAVGAEITAAWAAELGVGWWLTLRGRERQRSVASAGASNSTIVGGVVRKSLKRMNVGRTRR